MSGVIKPGEPPECEVSVTDVQGKRWALTVRARSLYSAVFAYNSEQVCGRYRHFPKLERSTAVDVRTADGREFRTTYGKVMDWANRPLPAQKR